MQKAKNQILCYTILFRSSLDYHSRIKQTTLKLLHMNYLWNDLLIKCAKTKKPIIISTGMANMREIKNAIKILKINGAKKNNYFTLCFKLFKNQLNH